jgi:aminoglycoside phosphotransferase (APT) family kinase protein
MKLVAAGRASEIFDLGDGRVLRRFKSSGDPAREALVMEHAARLGFPVPRVLDVTGDALVLERIEGPTMAEHVRRRVWTLRRHADVLARLHHELHRIPAPPTLAEVGPGDRLLHLDLHPANVILSPTGPVVIDWTNARRGDAAFDVAATWVIGATSGGGGHLVHSFLRRFLSHFNREELLRALPVAAAWRAADANVTESERRAIGALLERNGLGGAD